MKPSRMKEHLMKQYSDKSNKNILYFSDLNLKNKFEKRKTVSGDFFIKNILITIRSPCILQKYKVSLVVAKCEKPHTIGEKHFYLL